VVITQITHRGQSTVTGGPYTFTYMDPIALARLLGRTRDLAAALAAQHAAGRG
jgi:hypothetical protein